jgi:2-C-methyl-D-erythritol 4-phosphate cytidylyltransferase / 2-C-methyl-D-erythritol 2,4-cyclodiphosphate synthase
MNQDADPAELSTPKVAVVLVAAGRGERAGQAADAPKQYRRIGGRPIIARTLDAFLTHPAIGPIAIVIHPDDVDLLRDAIGDHDGKVIVAHGGATRQDSVRLGLAALRDRDPQKVLIHDAARPFVDSGLIDRVIAAIGERQAALPVLPVAETLKRANADEMVAETVSGDGLYLAQTPQGFPYWPINAAHEKAYRAGKTGFTDDAAIAEWAKMPVRIVPGSPDNAKLTWARDISMADQRLSGGAFPDVRTGNGYDVHAFEPGDHVVLCGVAIPHGKKLSGHSDADVALHALTDAILGALADGDIGVHFPPSDEKWRGASSDRFLAFAVDRVKQRGGAVSHLDVAIVCEAPKVSPHRDAMRARIAEIAGLTIDRVGVKATTNEKLGAIGNGEGIAAYATATIRLPWSAP